MRDLGKLIVAKGFKKLPKVQKIAQSGHTDCYAEIKDVFMRLLPNLTTYLGPCVNCILECFLNGLSLASFLFIFVFTITSIFTTNICAKCPSNLRCWDSNARPSEHKSPPITTRPGLQPTILECYLENQIFPHLSIPPLKRVFVLNGSKF